MVMAQSLDHLDDPFNQMNGNAADREQEESDFLRSIGLMRVEAKQSLSESLETASLKSFLVPSFSEDVNSVEDGESYNIDCLVRYLDPLLLEACRSKGINKFFPVQKTIIPVILSSIETNHLPRRRDICVASPTGSGKTLAFVLPIVQYLMNTVTTQLRAIIILPGQDSALQVFNVLEDFTTATNLKAAISVGNTSCQEDEDCIVKQKENGSYRSLIDILVTTPSRLINLINDCPGFDLSHLEVLVVDEVGRIIDFDLEYDWIQEVDIAVYGRRNYLCGCDLDGGHSNRRSFTSQVSGCAFNNYSPRTQTYVKLLFSATLSKDNENLHTLNLFQPLLFTASEDETASKITKKAIKRSSPAKLKARSPDSGDSSEETINDKSPAQSKERSAKSVTPDNSSKGQLKDKTPHKSKEKAAKSSEPVTSDNYYSSQETINDKGPDKSKEKTFEPSDILTPRKRTSKEAFNVPSKVKVKSEQSEPEKPVNCGDNTSTASSTLHNLFPKTRSPARAEIAVYCREHGIEVKDGRFTKSEDEQIIANFKNFCREHFIEGKQLHKLALLGFKPTSDDPEVLENIEKLRQLAKENNFHRHLALRLNDRLVSSVYQRARKILLPLRSEKDLDESVRADIIEYYRDSHAGFGKRDIFAHIGYTFNADLRAVRRIITRQLNIDSLSHYNHGRWHYKESLLLIQAIKKVTKKTKLAHVGDNIEWTRVSSIMGNRSPESCRSHFVFTIFPQAEFHDKNQEAIDRITATSQLDEDSEDYHIED